MTRENLIGNLSFIYRMIVASAPLLEFGIKRSEGDLCAYFHRHLAEETGHDEMLRDDLYRLGVRDIPRYHAAGALAGSQYYFIAHESPAMLLGYMAVLESAAPSVEIVDALEAAHMCELNALRHHAIHDPDHIKEINAQIEMQPEVMQSLIRWNAENTHKFLSNMLKGFE